MNISILGFMPTTYQSNFIPHTTQAPQNQEILPVYPQQPLQVVYPAGQPSQQTPIMYPNPNPMLYTQNPIYPNSVYPPTPGLPQNIPHYPQSTSTPNSCSSSVSNNAYCRQISEVPLQTVPVSSFSHITQSMGQLNLNPGVSSHPHYMQNQKQQKGIPQKGGSKYNGAKNFASCSSQNSTENSSPVTAIAVGSYAGTPASGMYRPATDTPPLHSVPLGYAPNYVQPVLCRQVSFTSMRAGLCDNC